MTKLEEVFKQRKIQEQNKKEILSSNIIKFPQFDEEVEINEYLNRIGLEILNIGIKSELAVGKKLEEVFQKLGNSKTGIYQKFIISLGINPRTALRQRMRYKYFENFSKLGFEKAKEIVSILPIVYLEKLNSLCSDKENEEILLEYLSDSNLTMDKFKDIIDTEIEEKKIAENKENGEILNNVIDFTVKWKALNKLSKKVDHLSNDRQKQIIEYLDKIQLLISESIQEEKNIEEAEVIK
ncbi:hypothetical protein [Fusobacterium sp. SYSU M8D902]|uniref:hypothetical protein n=1 Tax=Fusobacterium sp. SYSU M8D902 TaxID=3159562 RepID=UPI0032E5281D